MIPFLRSASHVCTIVGIAGFGRIGRSFFTGAGVRAGEGGGGGGGVGVAVTTVGGGGDGDNVITGGTSCGVLSRC